MNKKTVKIVIFLILVSLIGACVSKVLCFKYADGIQPMENFYKESPDSIDVLCIGSSHMFCNISTKTLWEDFGISSYDLGGSVQPFWNSYFYLKEALSYQKPRVVVLDVFRASLDDDEYIDQSRIIKNTFGITSVYNRTMSICTSVDKTKIMEYLLAFPTYHQRYNDISKVNFVASHGTPNNDNEESMLYSKGFLLFTDANKQLTKNIDNKSINSLGTKTEEYLIKIIKLCEKEKINLLLVKTPYAGDDIIDESYYARVEEIARENGIPFVNFNHLRDEIGLDFSVDALDVSHLNYRGNTKFTRYFGQYLKAHYDLRDHRGEAGYTSYEYMCQYLQRIIDNSEIQNTKDLKSFLKSLVSRKDKVVIVVSLQGECEIVKNDEDIRSQMVSLGIDSESLEHNSVWVLDGGDEKFHGDVNNRFDWHMLMKNGFVKVERKTPSDSVEFNINREKQTAIPNGVSIVIYDKELKHIIDRAGFYIENEKLGEKTVLSSILQ